MDNNEQQRQAVQKALQGQQTQIDIIVAGEMALRLHTQAGTMVTRSILRGDTDAAWEWALIRGMCEEL